jgi:hypothetical protein
MRVFLFCCLALFFGACSTDINDNNEVYQDWSPVQIKDVEKGIRAHIEKEARENGSFHIENDSLNLDVQLVRVHTEYLSILGPEEFFACVDLATTTGDVYDVDFFMSGTANQMEVTRQSVHKKNGQPFYMWKRKEDNTWHTVPVEGASSNLMGVLHGKDVFDFTYQVTLPSLEQNAALWIPLASSDRFQKIENYNVEAPVSYQIISDQNQKNQALYFELTNKESNGTIAIRYEVTRMEKGSYREDESELGRYMEATPLLPVGGRFDTLSTSIINEKEATSELMKARALYDYVVDNVRYAKQGKYGTADANYACDAKSGNCTEFHSLFISLARSAGIPARFEVGAAIPSERDNGGINGYHCWAEFYANGQWWPVDISEANKYSNLATYYFGHHPANRISFSKGRNMVFNPAPTTGPFAFFAYPHLEVNRQSVPVQETSFSFSRK